MNRGSWSVGFAAFVGCIVGGLIANELGGYLGLGAWLLLPGALIGGTVGWCIVGFGKFVAGVGSAWDKTINWKADREYWKAFSAAWCFMNTMLLSVFVYLFVPGGTVLAITAGEEGATKALILVASLTAGTMQLVVILLAAVAAERTPDREKRVTGFWESVRRMNPIALPFTVFPKAVEVARATPAFFREVYIEVHTERRRIVFGAILLGTLIGSFFGSTIIGALVGGVLGFVEHELVAVRWLKIKVK
jgi:hypothetical protein